jgi:hypothetical protein
MGYAASLCKLGSGLESSALAVVQPRPDQRACTAQNGKVAAATHVRLCAANAYPGANELL